MYGDNGAILGGVSTTVATGVVTVLPHAGADLLTELALSVCAGLVTWGVIYASKVAR
jgi:hypothetical protein